MSERINNGRRVNVEHEAYTGIAGMVERAGERFHLAFVKPERGKAVTVGGTIKIEGESWRIEAVKPSAVSKNMIVLTVAKEAENGVSD